MTATLQARMEVRWCFSHGEREDTPQFTTQPRSLSGWFSCMPQDVAAVGSNHWCIHGMHLPRPDVREERNNGCLVSVVCSRREFIRPTIRGCVMRPSVAMSCSNFYICMTVVERGFHLLHALRRTSACRCGSFPSLATIDLMAVAKLSVPLVSTRSRCRVPSDRFFWVTRAMDPRMICRRHILVGVLEFHVWPLLRAHHGRRHRVQPQLSLVWR